MMRIVEETPEPKGIHDVHNRMCCRYLYESHGVGPIDGCHEIISQGGSRSTASCPKTSPDTMDLLMNYHYGCGEGRWVIDCPVSKPGDHIEFEALMDCLVGAVELPDGRAGAVQRLQLHPRQNRGQGLSARSVREPAPGISLRRAERRGMGASRGGETDDVGADDVRPGPRARRRRMISGVGYAAASRSACHTRCGLAGRVKSRTPASPNASRTAQNTAG